jgi:hypothetical protein
LYIILVALMLCSCGNPFIPLKSDYSKVQKTFFSKYNLEDTWNKLLDVLVSTEIPIKTIGKSSRLLVSKTVNLVKDYSYELKVFLK